MILLLVTVVPAPAWVLSGAGWPARGVSRTWLSAEQPWRGELEGGLWERALLSACAWVLDSFTPPHPE